MMRNLDLSFQIKLKLRPIVTNYNYMGLKFLKIVYVGFVLKNLKLKFIYLFSECKVVDVFKIMRVTGRQKKSD